ncbi:ankyrin repeat domain-containing protein [Legionella nautarum]|uniref:ankyrin repeat domain-containing protein n=1 Tax=Legionella nautarum TaxID=45070 RepID=UPI0010541245|nr:ankyrin repeat domain-containing protein [Legionella nautarum]
MYEKTEQEDTNEEAKILTLPDELLTGVISYLHPKVILNTLRLVSRKFYTLSHDIAFWRMEFRQHSSTYFREERYLTDSRTRGSGFLESWLNLIINWAIRNKSQSLLDSFYQQVIVTRYQAWKKKGDINDRNGRTQSHWAAICNQLAEYQKADSMLIGIRDSKDRTDLVIAAQHGHLDLVNEILAKIDAKDSVCYGWTTEKWTAETNLALIYATDKGHFDIIEVLLNHGAELNAIECPRGTALMIAVANGHYDMVDFLLKKGADVNVSTNDGLTALTVAVDRRYLEIVRLLLKNGANANIISAQRQTVLYLAVINNQMEMIKILFENTNDSYVKGMALIDAFVQWRLQIVSFFAENSTLKDAISYDIFEALLLSTTLGGNSTKFKALLPVLSSDKIHTTLDTLLTIAVLCVNDPSTTEVNPGYIEIIEILSSHGGKIQAINDKETALIHLITHLERLKTTSEQNTKFKVDYSYDLYYRYHRAIKFLLIQGTDANATDEYGETALSLVAKKGGLKILSFLLDYGANVNTPSRGKKTALMHAAQGGHLKAVELLLEKGANVNATDDENNTALICAAEEGHFQIVSLLLKSGVSHAQKAEALARATMKGQLEVVNLLQVEMVSRATVDYLNWRATEAPGHRLLNRFNHWYHGTNGIKRTENILQSINSGVSPTQLMQEVKSAVEDSSHRKHSYSRYIFDVFKAPPTSTVNNQSDEDFLELKKEFLANFDQQFLSV